jgi:DNA repair protein RecN (Recombination protein N)
VGDEEELRARLDRLRHAEEISTEIATASNALGETGVDQAVGLALVSLDRVLRLDHGIADLRDRLASAMENVHEVSVDIARYGDSIEANPEALGADEQRLADLSALKRKYGETIADIGAFAKSASQRAETIEGLLDAAETLGVRHADAMNALEAAGTELTNVRASLAADVSSVAIDHL